MRHSRQPRQSAQNDKLVTMVSIRFLSAIAVAAALAACGGSSATTSGGPGGARSSGGPQFTLPPGLSTPKPVTISGQITLTQPKAVTAKFTTTADNASCQTFAKYGDGNDPSQTSTPDATASFRVPGAQGGVTFSDGNKGDVEAGDTGPYHGPGTYHVTGDQLSGSGSGLVWLAPFTDDNEPGQAGGDATLTITVHDDGSGEADFSGYIDPGSNTYAGKVSWTCSQ